MMDAVTLALAALIGLIGLAFCGFALTKWARDDGFVPWAYGYLGLVCVGASGVGLILR